MNPDSNQEFLADSLSVGIWVPPSGFSEEEAKDLVIRLNAVNQASQSLSKGELDPETFFDLAEYYGVNIDEYFGIVEENLSEVL